MPKHLVFHQTSIKEKNESNRNKLYDADEFVLTFHDFFGGLSEKIDSSIKGENTTI